MSNEDRQSVPWKKFQLNDLIIGVLSDKNDGRAWSQVDLRGVVVLQKRAIRTPVLFRK